MPAKKPTDVSVIDQLADDVEAETAPAEYPEGVPELRPWLLIRPRSRRAEFKRKYAEFAPMQRDVENLRKSGVFAAADNSEGEQSPEATADQLRAWADIDDYYQLIDELLELAAVDPDAYRAWSDEADDQTLMTTFAVYIRRTQPGEASSSAS